MKSMPTTIDEFVRELDRLEIGNGRMGRLLMNLVQMEGDVVPTYVRNENKAAYLPSLRQSQDSGFSAPFHEFMCKETYDILSSMIAEYRRDMKQDVPWLGEAASFAPQVTPQVPPKIDYLVEELLDVLGDDMLPTPKAGLVEPTIPGKPRSPRQKTERPMMAHVFTSLHSRARSQTSSGRRNSGRIKVASRNNAERCSANVWSR